MTRARAAASARTLAGVPHPGREGPAKAVASQTLDRGLRVLELVAESEQPMTAAEVAVRVGLHRSVTYRMLRTLQDHGLLARDREGRYLPGTALAALARHVASALTATALPHLERLADSARMTAFLVVRHGDEALTVAVVEPRVSEAHVVYRPGARHAIGRGAPGLALLAGGPPRPDERPQVARARRVGWAFTEGEVVAGLRACAAPVVDRAGTCHAAVSVVFVGTVDLDTLGSLVAEVARAVSAGL